MAKEKTLVNDFPTPRILGPEALRRYDDGGGGVCILDNGIYGVKLLAYCLGLQDPPHFVYGTCTTRTTPLLRN